MDHGTPFVIVLLVLLVIVMEYKLPRDVRSGAMKGSYQFNDTVKELLDYYSGEGVFGHHGMGRYCFFFPEQLAGALPIS